MSEECTHDCSSCSAGCSSSRQSMIEKLNAKSTVRKVIGIVSGKGGVGKSMVTSMLAVLMSRKDKSVGILDADITGPSIPKIFGLHDKIGATEDGIIPAETKTGIKVMSINLILEDESSPVIWRGPVIAGTVKQFWTDVVWDDVDYMFVDMPPGTGDVPLTVFQSLPVDGIVIVTSPQELVSMIVSKAVSMAELMNIPVLGIVENMSYLQCPDCGKKIEVFGKSTIDKVAKEHGLDVIARVPIDPEVASKCDSGDIEDADVYYLDEAVTMIEEKLSNK